MLLYADWLRNKGRLEEASQFFEQLTQSHAHAELANRALAELWWNQGHYARALPALKRLCELLPEDESLWHRWVYACEQANNPEALIEAFEWRARQRKPLSSGIHINWGRALWQLQRYEEALHHFALAIQMEPTNPNALLNAGDALYQLGAYAEAADAYSVALELDPLQPAGMVHPRQLLRPHGNL
ncbi:MAG: hypothetical protein KatS3mg021_1658 [Fimbriimonadales bacterium]|nr:MAG: hypothetical protein KatS3mg021_1658 [Fimbriimonadales bacterium]